MPKSKRVTDRMLDEALDKKVSRLVARYHPGPAIDNWAKGIKIYFQKKGWKSHGTAEEALEFLNESFIWIEILFELWREEVGVPLRPKYGEPSRPSLQGI